MLVTSSTHLWRAAQEFQAVGLKVIPAPSGMVGQRESGVFRCVPGPGALLRSNAAIYEMLGEPMRRLQAALGVRERFDRKAAERRMTGAPATARDSPPTPHTAGPPPRARSCPDPDTIRATGRQSAR